MKLYKVTLSTKDNVMGPFSRCYVLAKNLREAEKKALRDEAKNGRVVGLYVSAIVEMNECPLVV